MKKKKSIVGRSNRTIKLDVMIHIRGLESFGQH